MLNFQINIRKVSNEYRVKDSYTGKFKTKQDWDKGDGGLPIYNSTRSLDEVMKIIEKILNPYKEKEEIIGKPKLSFRIQVFQINKKFSVVNKETGKKETQYNKKSATKSIYNLDMLSQPQLMDLIKRALKSSK